jgi:hypothetical protein
MRRAKVPGGAEIDFGEQARATTEALDNLNTRVTVQMEVLNKRLYDLEKRVFKDRRNHDDGGDEDGAPDDDGEQES